MVVVETKCSAPCKKGEEIVRGIFSGNMSRGMSGYFSNAEYRSSKFYPLSCNPATGLKPFCFVQAPDFIREVKHF